eukprot:6491256-Amphidinium_carterae.1
MMQREFPKLAEWRWGTVLNVLSQLVASREALEFWNLESFKAGDTSGPRADVNLELITAALTSPFFWAIANMILVVQLVLDEFERWADSCGCCASEAQRKKKRQGSMFLNCPMSTRRATDMATGTWRTKFDATASVLTTVDLETASFSEPLNQAERTSILQDFTAAMSHIRTQLELKLSFWESLPWKLAGICHVDQTLARLCASECIRLFDNVPDLAAHHPLSIAVLQTGTTARTELDLYIRGSELCSLPHLLQLVLPVALIPIGERPIEMRHSLVSRRVAGKTRRHPTTVSLSNRVIEINARLAADPGFFASLTTAFAKVRDIKSMLHEFQFLAHDKISDPAMQASHIHRVLPICVELFYGVCLEQQFMSPALRRQNELMRRHVAQLARRIQTNQKPMPSQTAVQKMQWGHLIEWFEQHLEVRFLSLPVPESVHVNAQSLRGLQGGILQLGGSTGTAAIAFDDGSDGLESMPATCPTWQMDGSHLCFRIT